MKNISDLISRGVSGRRVLYRSEVIIRVVIGVFLAYSLYLISQANFLLYYGMATILSALIAFSIFLIIWNSHKRLQNHFFLILSAGLAFSSLFGLLHIISYPGIGIVQIDHQEPQNVAFQLLIVASCLQAAAYLTAAFFFKKPSAGR